MLKIKLIFVLFKIKYCFKKNCFKKYFFNKKIFPIPNNDILYKIYTLKLFVTIIFLNVLQTHSYKPIFISFFKIIINKKLLTFEIYYIICYNTILYLIFYFLIITHVFKVVNFLVKKNTFLFIIENINNNI